MMDTVFSRYVTVLYFLESRVSDKVHTVMCKPTLHEISALICQFHNSTLVHQKDSLYLKIALKQAEVV